MNSSPYKQYHWPKSLKVDSDLSLNHALGLIHDVVSNRQGVLVVYDSSWEYFSCHQRVTSTMDSSGKFSWLNIQQKTSSIGLIICATSTVDSLVELSDKFSVPIVSLSAFSSELSINVMYGLLVTYIVNVLSATSKSKGGDKPRLQSVRRYAVKQNRRNMHSQKLLARVNYPFVVSSHKGQHKGRARISSRPPKR
jgi:hypothetical protein